jgi:hypothetical protein
MFILTKKEFDNLRSQIATSSWGGTRYLPMCFTEHGVLQAASVLNSPKADQMSIYIIEAFVKMRQALQVMSLNADNPQLLAELLKQYNRIIKKLEKQDEKLDKHDNEIAELSRLVNIIIQKMLPASKEIKIKGFQLKNEKNN